MGLPTIGMLRFAESGGLGKAFGTKGQGNELKDLASSDVVKNYVSPAQNTDKDKCKESYLYVMVTGTADQ
jgi:hypothetical protein